jgi:hypothetical protein
VSLKNYTLDLGSTKRVASSEDKNVISKIIGDFYPIN